MRFALLAPAVLTLASACAPSGKTEDGAAAPRAQPLFESVAASASGLDFRNDLAEGPNASILLYEYFYNGGGVAVADFDGDGREDLYFTANMGANRLYLNRTDGPDAPLRFEDVTEPAGVAGRPGPWTTGTSAADVNGDGRPDLFVAYSGMVPPAKRRNQLFINLGNDARGRPRFGDRAAAWGLDGPSFTTQGYFFDADADADLDLLLVNHNPRNLPILNARQTDKLRAGDDPERGTRLLINEGTRFVDRTRAAGIDGSALSYGLSAALSDFDGDGRTDVYLCNDYAVPDRLYRNLGGGRFAEVLAEQMPYTSQSSMGSDAADVNGDGRPDLLTLDMLPPGNRRQKLLQAPDNYAKFDHDVATGFGYQYMRNMLHLNGGAAGFTEVGQSAGVEATDWSWAALLADFDLDGHRDLFVTNGHRRNLTNLDFVRYLNDLTRQRGRLSKTDVLTAIARMPAEPVRNAAFRGGGGAGFAEAGAAWGLDAPGHSQGAAYADLDGDGDLDLVVNNLDTVAGLYRNRAAQRSGHHFLRLRLEGDGNNPEATGARAWVYADDRRWLAEQYAARGYQSSVSPVLHFGLGDAPAVDSLAVDWPGGRRSVVIAPPFDTTLTLAEVSATRTTADPEPDPSPYFTAIGALPGFAHATPQARDFDRQRLLLTELSAAGPVLLAEDFDADGRPELFAGGGVGQPSVLYHPDAPGEPGPFAELKRPSSRSGPVWAATGLDADGDGLRDLYLAVGGYHDYGRGDAELQDELWLGRGGGRFAEAPDSSLPDMTGANGAVVAVDWDGDGDEDLFVGGRVVPGRWPEAPLSHLLRNDGRGGFRDVTRELGPGLAGIGMVTAAVRLDVDGRPGLLIVSDWGAPRQFAWDGKTFVEELGRLPPNLTGCWNSVTVAELNGDGRPDVVLGNQGSNGPLRPSSARPLRLFHADFDGNGSVDPVVGRYYGDTLYPHATRDELLGQVSALARRYTDYASYAGESLPAVLRELGPTAPGELTAERLETTLLLSDGDGGYGVGELPAEAQYGPVHAAVAGDVDGDGRRDLLLFGNDTRRQLRLGMACGMPGLLLRGDGGGGFETVGRDEVGLNVSADVRGVALVGKQLYLGVSGGEVAVYSIDERAVALAANGGSAR